MKVVQLRSSGRRFPIFNRFILNNYKKLCNNFHFCVVILNRVF